MKNLVHASLVILLSSSTIHPVFAVEPFQSVVNRAPAQSRLSEAARLSDLLMKTATIPNATEADLSSMIKDQHAHNAWKPILFRDEKIDEALDVMVRRNYGIPVLIGGAGVGKSAVALAIAEKIIYGKIPAGVHAREFANPLVIRTNPSEIARTAQPAPSAQSEAVVSYFKAIRAFEEKNGCRVVVVVEKAHLWNEGQIQGLDYLFGSGRKMPAMVWTANAKAAAFGIKESESIRSVIQEINIPELSVDQTLEVLKQSMEGVEKYYNLKISDDVLKTVISVGSDVNPDLLRPAGAQKFLEDVALISNTRLGGRIGEVSKAEIYEIAAKKSNLPVVPQDREKFLKYMEQVKTWIKQDVKGQDQAVDEIVDVFAEMMTSSGKKTRSVFIVGLSGVGKSMIAKRLAYYVFGSTERLLSIDMTNYKDKNGGTKLFGPGPGYIGSDKTKGIFAEFFDGRGRGLNIVVTNEVEKGSVDYLEQEMEILDTGTFTPGDGRERNVGRSFWIYTSNKGATKFFPDKFVRNATPELIADKLQKTSEDDIKAAFLQQESNAKAEEVIKPEVLNRIDKMILYAPLLKGAAQDIADGVEKKALATLADAGSGKVQTDERFSQAIVDETYDPITGARALERRVNKEIQKISDAHIKKFGISEHLTISTLDPEPGTNHFRFVAANERGETLTLAGPKLSYQNKMFDPEFKAKLKSMEIELNSKVFGQTEYVKLIVQLAQAHATDARTTRPLSLYSIGLTGTGKTELAKVVAKHMFGSDEYLKVIDMGEVSTIHDLGKIFQSAPGTVGADQPGIFESFLQSYSKGVILWDEMSNVGGGGNNPQAAQVKSDVAKKFYTMLDEGSWTSPVTKRTYSLKDYYFIFTGNDGENLFAGITADDMVRAIWMQNRSPKRVHEILSRAGFPNAFLGRMNGMVLMEPPVSDSKIAVANKFVTHWKEGLEESQPVKISYPDHFSESVARLTYSVLKGGRSTRDFVEKPLESLVAKAIFEIDYQTATKENPVQIKVWLESVEPKSPFYLASPDAVKATVHVEATQNGEVIYTGSTDFTESAQFMKQIRVTDAYATAFHEAAHAVLNNPRMTGQLLEHLTVIPSDGYLGYARYVPIPGYVTNFTHENLQSKLVGLAGGSVAETLIGRLPNSGQGGDLEQANDLLRRAATEWGLCDGLQGIRKDADGKIQLSPVQEEIYQKFAEKELATAREIAATELTKKWFLVRRVASELIKNGEITGTRYNELGKKYKLMSAESLEIFNQKYGPTHDAEGLQRMDARICNVDLEGYFD